jgi:hypothetical protein
MLIILIRYEAFPLEIDITYYKETITDLIWGLMHRCTVPNKNATINAVNLYHSVTSAAFLLSPLRATCHFTHLKVKNNIRTGDSTEGHATPSTRPSTRLHNSHRSYWRKQHRFSRPRICLLHFKMQPNSRRMKWTRSVPPAQNVPKQHSFTAHAADEEVIFD